MSAGVAAAAAQQAGVFFSPIDAAWGQSVPDRTRSILVRATIGDNSTIGTGIQCINISDSDGEPVEQVVQAWTRRSLNRSSAKSGAGCRPGVCGWWSSHGGGAC